MKPMKNVNCDHYNSVKPKSSSFSELYLNFEAHCVLIGSRKMDNFGRLQVYELAILPLSNLTTLHLATVLFIEAINYY